MTLSSSLSSNAPSAGSEQGTSSSSSSIQNRDMIALKQYITAQDHSNPYQDGRLHHNTLLVDLTHSNLQQQHIEQRLDRHMTISQIKIRIHQKTGTPPHFQRLILKSGTQILQEIPATEEENHHQQQQQSWDDYKLGYFFGSGMTMSSDANNNNVSIFLPSLSIHCIDINPHSTSRGGQLEDTSLIEKYKMTDEEYNQRSNTLRDWSRQQKQIDPNFTLRKHAQYHRELCDAQRQHKLGLPLPNGFVLDSTGKVIRDEPDVIVPPQDAKKQSTIGNMMNHLLTMFKLDNVVK